MAEGSTTRRVADLEPGDRIAGYGTVVHREGRKVWFDDRVVTFGSPDEEVVLTASGRPR